MKTISRFLILMFLLLNIISCFDDDKTMIPKPRTYPKVVFPKKTYKTFTSKTCNFQFDYPIYAKVVKETKFLKGETPNDCWFNVIIPKFHGQIYLTYYPINNQKEFDKYIVNSFELTSAHNIKATGRQEIRIKNRYNSSGILFNVKGNVASQTQFFLTDTTANFIRGALYFNNKVNVDSMKIIQEFIEKDVKHLISTFKWLE